MLKQHDHVIITNNGVGEAVLINFEDYAHYEEFLHQRYIYNELQKSKAEMSDPNSKWHIEEDVYAELDQILEKQGL